MLSRTLVLKVSGWKPVERLIRSKAFRPFVRRFVPGETIPEAIVEAERLVAQGFYTSLDYLGENTKTEQEARAATDIYIRMVEAIALSACSAARKSNVRETVAAGAPPSKDPYDDIDTTNISIKLTQLGLDLGVEKAECNYLQLLGVAEKHNLFVRVDMEGSPYTELTIQMLDRAFREHENTGTVLQAYLLRTPRDVDWAIGRKMRIRLVKGAYLEAPEIALQNMDGIRAAYLQLAKELLANGRYPAFATHDEKLIKDISMHAASEGIPKDRYEFQMLYGIRRDIQERLLKEGYNVRVYIPFGESWYPYFSRRLAERPANLWFLLKSLFRK